LRVGHGFDAHKLVSGRPLILGGLHIPFPMGLDGHSDADVLCHAIMDALLGAAALGDIGCVFPSSDMTYYNADSTRLMAHVARMLRESGYEIGNVDATLLAQAPRLAPYTQQMCANIANAIDVSVESISVKATTEEGMGYTGRGEGIACHSVCTIIPRR